MRNSRRILTIGEKINRLTLVEKKFFTKENTKVPQYYWFCKCECGNTTWVRPSRVATQFSCGCIMGEKKRLAYGQAARNCYFRHYKNNAKTKDLEFSLSVEQFEQLTSSKCHYCGDSPSITRYNSPAGYGGYMSNGIDRKDSSVGYVIDNCLPCCKTCNFAKNTMSYDDFIAWIGRLIYFRGMND